MTFEEYKSELYKLPFGKILPNAIYVYRSGTEVLGVKLHALVEKIELKYETDKSFNLLKFRTDELKISLLSYPDFFTDPHPVLVKSLTVDLVTRKGRWGQYDNNPNPPILHRKETFISTDHEYYEQFQKLTKAEEEAGLLEDKSRMGFKLNWLSILDKKGYCHKNHKLKLKETTSESSNGECAKTSIERHKTAIARYELSKPIKCLLEQNLLRNGDDFFDYGCGLGTDIKGLTSLGYNAVGWDPVHSPDSLKNQSDIVNLGFVLNVIEDPAERVQTLIDAHKLSKKLLIVSTLTKRGDEDLKWKPYKDGVLTSRNTFQKYFEQSEIHQFIEDVLDTTAVPISLGIFLVFREVKDQQDFLSARARRDLDWNQIKIRLGLGKPKISAEARRRQFYEDNKGIFDDFWNVLLLLGRFPREGEFSKNQDLKDLIRSPKLALKLLLEIHGHELWNESRRLRKEDLLVYVAIANLRKKIPFNQLSETLRYDIRTFFKNYTNALKEGLELLYASGDPDEIELACEELSVGWQDQQALYLHNSILGELPPILRAYIGCASLRYGDVQETDIIKLHKRSGKVTFLKYEKFDRAVFPRLETRTKVDLRSGWVLFFDHYKEGQLLCFKERFLPENHSNTNAMKRWANKLRKLGVEEEKFDPGFRQVHLDKLKERGNF